MTAINVVAQLATRSPMLARHDCNHHHRQQTWPPGRRKFECKETVHTARFIDLKLYACVQ